jgi:MYXO-CTERM domain-containing protein
MTITTRSLKLLSLRAQFASTRLHTALLMMGSAVTGCAVPGDEIEDDVELSEASSELSVGSFVTSTCSTSSVRGLSVQIAQEVDCMSPDSLVRFSSSTRIAFASNAVLPYLHPRAKTDLIAAANEGKLTVNSGYRTVAQQYLLYRWKELGRCGITAAATPGRSNHESGRAIDLGNWSTRVSIMGRHGFAHSVPGDPVHFDNTRSPDNRGKDVRAFQRLWNRNHPGDQITVDGAYGPQTASRLKQSPATGFAKGAQCRVAERGAEILAISGPDQLAPGMRTRYVFTVANTQDFQWSASTRVVVAGGGASDLYDAQTWASPSEVGAIGAAIPAAGEGKITIDIAAPQVAEETAAFTTFALVDNGVQVGTIDLAVTIAPDADPDVSGDAADGHDHEEGDEEADEDGVLPSGCSTGGGTGRGALALAVAGLMLLRRRRRA